MKLSNTSRYALMAVIRMATLPPDQVSIADSLAKDLAIPEAYLRRLLVLLAKAGILRSSKGPHGGYWLARPAKKITLLDVIEAVEGTITAKVDPVGTGADAERLDGRLRKVYEQVTEIYRKQMAGVTVAGLAHGGGGDHGGQKRKAKG